MKKVTNILKKRDYYNIYQSSYVCFVAKEIIDGLFGENSVKIVSFKNKQLRLRAENNFLATEIKMRKEMIIDQINKKIKTTQIQDIRTV